MKENNFSKTMLKVKESRITMRVLPIVILAFLCVLFGIATGGRFFKINNLMIILNQALIVGTVATGASFIFASGNVNSAMGSGTALIVAVAALVYNATNSLLLMFLVAIVLGVVVMAFSAVLSTKFHIRVVMVTIVMMTLLSSLQQAILDNQTINLPYKMTSMLKNANFSYITFILFFAVCYVLFHHTKLGRSLKFIGTNPTCAELTGIDTNKTVLIAFVIAGIGAGLGALMTIVRSGSVNQATANTLNMDCMLALILGGMSVFGGTRSYVYAGIIGAVTVTALNNGLIMIGVPSEIIQAIRGVLFLLIIVMSQKRPSNLPAREV